MHINQNARTRDRTFTPRSMSQGNLSGNTFYGEKRHEKGNQARAFEVVYNLKLDKAIIDTRRQ